MKNLILLIKIVRKSLINKYITLLLKLVCEESHGLFSRNCSNKSMSFGLLFKMSGLHRVFDCKKNEIKIKLFKLKPWPYNFTCKYLFNLLFRFSRNSLERLLRKLIPGRAKLLRLANFQIKKSSIDKLFSKRWQDWIVHKPFFLCWDANRKNRWIFYMFASTHWSASCRDIFRSRQLYRWHKLISTHCNDLFSN